MEKAHHLTPKDVSNILIAILAPVGDICTLVDAQPYDIC